MKKSQIIIFTSLFLLFLLFMMNVVLSVAEAIAAEHEIEFVEERVGTAIFKIDQRTYFLKPGEPTPDGIELVSISKDEAIIRVNDTQYRYAKGSNKGELIEVRLYKPRHRNHFIARGTINNKPVTFLIDTGATWIFLSKKQAQRLGIRYRMSQHITVLTASEPVKGIGIKLDSVSVGDIRFGDVMAVIVEGYTDELILLGMLFLNKVNFSTEGGHMVLRPK